MRKRSTLRVIFWTFVILAVVAALAVLAVGIAPMVVLVLASATQKLTPGQVAMEGTDDFYERYNRGDTDAYDRADAAFKKEISREDFLKLLDRLHRQLGAWQSTATYGGKTDTTAGVTTVALPCTSTFANGEAEEEFRYLISGRHATLQGYRITSPKLTAD